MKTELVKTLPRRHTLSRDLADQLCREIRKQRLAPGTPLGTEADLAARFGVSRTVVREAIGNLQGLGIVTSRQGFGLSVSRVNVSDTLSKAFVPMVASGLHWPELCHLRFVLEVGSVPLAVERATEAQIGRMRQLSDEMLKLVRKRCGITAEITAQISAREIEFHDLVFEAANSGLAGEFHKILVGYFEESYGQGAHPQPPSLRDMRDHAKLVAAFAARDASRAVSILTEHIRPMLLSQS